MEKVKVGSVEEHDVIYVPERDIVFCKNTVLPFSLVKEILHSKEDRIEVKEKNMTIRIYPESIEMGCLTTTRENYKQIVKTIKKLKNNEQ